MTIEKKLELFVAFGAAALAAIKLGDDIGFLYQPERAGCQDNEIIAEDAGDLARKMIEEYEAYEHGLRGVVSGE